MPASHGSRPEYDVSMWPLHMSDFPPPVPSSRPMMFGRPSSTSCHCTWSPMSASSSRTRSPIACSFPVGLGTDTRSTASATSRSASISAEMRQHLASEQLDLLVAPLSPKLEHHMGAARLSVFLDRLDAVGRGTGNGLALVQDLVRHLGLGGETATLFHCRGHGPDLVLLEA